MHKSLKIISALIASVSISFILNADIPENIIIDDFETISGWEGKLQPASVEKCTTPKAGNMALKIKMPGVVSKTYGKYWFPESEKINMNEFQGISFWLQGDGSDNWGNITISDRYDYSYSFYFPVKNKDWHKVNIRWNDFIPQGEYDAINSHKTALTPDAIINVKFGNQWKLSHNNKPIRSYEFNVDNLQFEKEIKAPASPGFGFSPIQNVLSKIKNKKEVKILCIGDSITVGVGLKDMEKSRYAKLLETMMRDKFGYDKIFIESRAVGGSDLVWARTWVNRDFDDSNADLIIIHYGYNDKSRKFTAGFFRKSMEDYLNKITTKTKGQTAILLLSTIPGIGPRFNMLNDYSDTVKSLAQEKNIACIDLHKMFADKGESDLRNYYSDMAHPNEKGHEFMAENIYNYFEDQVKNTVSK